MTRKTQKKLRKLLTLVCCAVMLVCVTVGATVAYLTSQDSVTNTFAVGNVIITLDETDVDESKTDVTTAGRDKANNYHLFPGHTYTKDPIVHVDANSEDCYLFVKVENGISAIEADTKIAAQMGTNGWTLVKDNIYVYNTVVNAGANVPVFGTFTIADNVDGTTLANYANAKITVTAYAVQADGFETSSAAEIWAAAFEA